MSFPVRVHILVSTLIVGGAEQLLRDLLLRLDPEKIKTKLLFFKDPGPIGDECIAGGVPAITGIMPDRINPLAIPKLAGILRRDAADVLLCINHRNSLLLGVPAAKLAGVPVVNWHNETYKRYSQHRLTMALRRIAHRGVRCIVAAAKGHADYIRNVERLPAREIRVIYNAVDPDRACSRLTAAQAREALAVPPDARAVAQVAALRPDKAHEVMLDAMAIVAAREPRALLLIAGDGPRRPFLEERMRTLGLQQHCRFLGVVRDVGAVLAASDIMALSSHPRQETLSVAAIEAMFAHRPVVSTRVGFMDEIVIPGETGELVQPEDPRALAEALLSLLQNDDKRRRMGDQASNFIAAICHIDVMARKFEQLFTELAQEKKAPDSSTAAPGRPVRICFLVSWREQGRWYFLRKLREKGLDVRVLQPLLLEEGVPDKIRKISLRLSRFYLPLAGLLFHGRATVWASWNMPTGAVLGLIKRIGGRLLPPHIVRDFHIDPAWKTTARRKLRLLRLAAPGMDFVLTTSRREEQAYAREFGFAPDRIRFFPDCPPSELLQVPPAAPGEYVFAYGNSDRDFDTLLAAARKLDRPVVILSQRYTATTGTPANVRLVRHYVSQDQLCALIGGACCCVLPLKDFNVAAGQNAMLEIMTLGRPLVAADNIATREYGVHGETALFYRIGNADDLARQIQRALADPVASAAMAARGRAKAETLLDEQVERFLGLLPQVANLG